MCDSAQRKRFLSRIPARRVVRCVVICLLVLAAWVSLGIHKARRQQEAVAAIRGMGGYVRYDSVADFKQLTEYVTNVEVVYCPSKMDDASMALLEAFPRLKSLTLSGSAVTDAGLKSVARLRNLRELDLASTRIGNNGLGQLEGLTRLTKIDLSHTDVTGSGLTPLRHLSRLRELRLRGTALMYTERTEGPIPAALADGVDKVFGDAIEVDGGQVPLRIRVLVTGPPTDAGLAVVATLRQLRVLDVAQTDLTDSAFSYITPLRELEQLNLEYNRQVTDRGLEQVSELTKLRYLCLSGTGMTDTGMASVGKLVRLKRLSLDDTAISGPGLRHLQPLRELTTLSLAVTNLDDAAAPHLARLSSLQELDLTETAVTDNTLDSLKGLRQLRRLCLADTTVTDAGIENLRASLPELVVRR